MSDKLCLCAVCFALCCVRPYVVYVLRVFCVMCAHCEMCVISSVFFLLRLVYFGARHFACVVCAACFACGCGLRVLVLDRWVVCGVRCLSIEGNL